MLGMVYLAHSSDLGTHSELWSRTHYKKPGLS
jgi:hypothetical protein